MSGSISPFVYKTYQLVSGGQTNNDVVSWNVDGTSLVVLDTFTFEKEVLPHFFKHNNFSSFVRQLNTYGFHKVQNADPKIREFSHPHFRKDCPGELSKVKRKGKSSQPRPSSAKSSLASLPSAVPVAIPSLEETASFTGQVLPKQEAQMPYLPPFQPQTPLPEWLETRADETPDPSSLSPAQEDPLRYLLNLCKKQKATEERLASLCMEWRETKDRLDMLTSAASHGQQSVRMHPKIESGFVQSDQRGDNMNLYINGSPANGLGSYQMFPPC